eukprot:TRINITY_DN36086_c0_g1_i1.p1 TRINITY_DN36086_c0_g1~~TRINITY_DN36086_c0_g1_i1.p1  ORF type:complete len:359 (+),score=120.77 TRINITY_DN36086_c0_g1_i1:73-1077(+)
MSAALEAFYAKDAATRKLLDLQQGPATATSDLQAQLLAFQRRPVPFVRVPAPGTAESKLSSWTMVIVGPPGTPFEGGAYTFNLDFPTAYPDAAPALSCLTENGSIPEGPLVLPSLAQWQPGTGVGAIACELVHHLLTSAKDEPLIRSLASEAKPADDALGALGLQSSDVDLAAVSAFEESCKLTEGEACAPLRWTPEERELTLIFRGYREKHEIASLVAAVLEQKTPTPPWSENSGSPGSRVECELEPLRLEEAQFVKYWAHLRQEECSEVVGEPRWGDSFMLIKTGCAAASTHSLVIVLAMFEGGTVGPNVLRVKSDCAATALAVLDYLVKRC